MVLNLLRDAKEGTRAMHLEGIEKRAKLAIQTALDIWDTADESLIQEYWDKPEPCMVSFLYVFVD